MLHDLSSKKFLVMTVFFIGLFVSPVAAEWNVTVNDDYVNKHDNAMALSQGQPSVMIAQLETNQGREINESVLTDQSEFIFQYNKTSGEEISMTHFHNEYWYARFPAEQNKHGISGNKAKILFEANGDTYTNDGIDSDGVQNDTGVVQVGNYTVKPNTALENSYLPGEDITFEANVTRLNDSAHVDNANAYVYYTNGTWTSNRQSLTYNATRDVYEKEDLSIPSGSNNSYVMRLVAGNSSSPLPNPWGSYSTVVDTEPELSADLETFSAQEGCQTTTMVEKCEQRAEIDAQLNVTSSSADQANLTVYKINRSNGGLVEHTNKTMSEEAAGIYSSSFYIPELNTSKYRREVKIEFQLSNGKQHETLERTVQYDSLTLKNTGMYQAELGKNYTVKFLTARPYTLKPYETSRFSNLTVNITDGDNQHFRELNKSEIKYNDTTKRFYRDIEIPDTAPSGGWDFELTATDKYGHKETITWRVSVGGTTERFQVSDTTFDVTEEGPQEFNFTVENLAEQKLEFGTEVNTSITDILQIEDEGKFNVTAGNTTNVTATVNMTQLESTEGAVNFTTLDTGNEKQMIFDLNAPGCEEKNGSLCTFTETDREIEFNSRGQNQESFEFLYTAGEGLETNLTTEVSGNLSQATEINEDYTIEDRKEITANFTVDEKAFYTGTIKFSTDQGENLTFNIDLDTNFTAEEKDVSLSSGNETVELGAFPRGENREVQVSLTNKGELEIQNITATSIDYLVNMETQDINLSAGETENVNLTFEAVTTEEGNMTFSGNTTETNVSLQLPVNATPVQNYTQDLSELSQRKTDLRPVTKANLTETLREVTTLVTEVRNNWDEGNYLTARSKYNEAERKLDYVANNKVTGGGENGSDTGGSDDDTGTGTGQDPGDSDSGTGGGDTGGGDTGTTQEGGGGGGLLIPIIVIIIVLVIAGFVFYESYIPEEGDPLYGVLGE